MEKFNQTPKLSEELKQKILLGIEEAMRLEAELDSDLRKSEELILKNMHRPMDF